jgi:hypothetical protein
MLLKLQGVPFYYSNDALFAIQVIVCNAKVEIDLELGSLP